MPPEFYTVSIVYALTCVAAGFLLGRWPWWRNHYGWFTWPMLGLAILLFVKAANAPGMGVLLWGFYGIAALFAWRALVWGARRGRRHGEAAEPDDPETLPTRSDTPHPSQPAAAAPEETGAAIAPPRATDRDWQVALKDTSWWRPLIFPGSCVLLALICLAPIIFGALFSPPHWATGASVKARSISTAG